MIFDLILELWAHFASPKQEDKEEWWRQKSWLGKAVVILFRLTLLVFGVFCLWMIAALIFDITTNG